VISEYEGEYYDDGNDEEDEGSYGEENEDKKETEDCVVCNLGCGTV
jgi:hypothetical protein